MFPIRICPHFVISLLFHSFTFLPNFIPFFSPFLYFSFLIPYFVAHTYYLHFTAWPLFFLPSFSLTSYFYSSSLLFFHHSLYLHLINFLLFFSILFPTALFLPSCSLHLLPSSHFFLSLYPYALTIFSRFPSLFSIISYIFLLFFPS